MPGWKSDLPRHFDRSCCRTYLLDHGALLRPHHRDELRGAAGRRHCVHATAESMRAAEQCGDDFTLLLSRSVRGVTLAQRGGATREAGLELLISMRQSALNERFTLPSVPITETYLARRSSGSATSMRPWNQLRPRRRSGRGRIDMAGARCRGPGRSIREPRHPGDLDDAKAAIDRLAAMRTDAGYVLNDIWLLRSAGSASPSPERRRGLPRPPRSLPRHGEQARFRGSYGHGRGDGLNAYSVSSSTARPPGSRTSRSRAACARERCPVGRPARLSRSGRRHPRR